MTVDEMLRVLGEKVLGFGMQLLLASVILFAGLMLIKYTKKLICRSMERAGKLDRPLRSFIVSMAGITLTAGLIVLIVSVFDIQTVSFAAVLGAAGLALGLALQGSLSNFAGGFLILVLKPFKQGDFIDINGTMGTVEDMDIFYTKLKTADNKKVVVPNSMMISSKLINFSEKDERRIDLEIGVTYESEVEEVKHVLSDAIDNNIYVLKEPVPLIRLGEMGDSALIYHVRIWCSTADYWNAYYDVTEAIKKALDANGISIPYPQMDLHIKKEIE